MWSNFKQISHKSLLTLNQMLFTTLTLFVVVLLIDGLFFYHMKFEIMSLDAVVGKDYDEVRSLLTVDTQSRMLVNSIKVDSFKCGVYHRSRFHNSYDLLALISSNNEFSIDSLISSRDSYVDGVDVTVHDIDYEALRRFFYEWTAGVKHSSSYTDCTFDIRPQLFGYFSLKSHNMKIFLERNCENCEPTNDFENEDDFWMHILQNIVDGSVQEASMPTLSREKKQNPSLIGSSEINNEVLFQWNREYDFSNRILGVSRATFKLPVMESVLSTDDKAESWTLSTFQTSIKYSAESGARLYSLVSMSCKNSISDDLCNAHDSLNNISPKKMLFRFPTNDIKRKNINVVMTNLDGLNSRGNGKRQLSLSQLEHDVVNPIRLKFAMHPCGDSCDKEDFSEINSKHSTLHLSEHSTKLSDNFPSQMPSFPNPNPIVYQTQYPTEYPASVTGMVFPTRNPTCYPSKCPTVCPTSEGTSSLTIPPTQYPTYYPSEYPTVYPTAYGSNSQSTSPTQYPTCYPSEYPTEYPTADSQSTSPTQYPTCNPTVYPTVHPTSYPTQYPTTYPTEEGTNVKTTHPTSYPSSSPTLYPTSYPTHYPTIYPTAEGTKCESVFPTSHPTFPTVFPTTERTNTETSRPTCYPSSFPSQYPTCYPTIYPTAVTLPPSHNPTSLPTQYPTSIPTQYPTFCPTQYPSACPSAIPTELSTMCPTRYPTVNPSMIPTIPPSNFPTLLPSPCPTTAPTNEPTVCPTANPSFSPSCGPISHPTSVPTFLPSIQPSLQPSLHPTIHPTEHPTVFPSISPTAAPSEIPSTPPSSHPTVLSSTFPSFAPTSKFTQRPTPSPTGLPTSIPSSYPTDFFSHYDIRESLLDKANALSDDVTSFQYYANSNDDYINGESPWLNFITDNFVDSSFDLDYYSIKVTSAIIYPGEVVEPFGYSAYCTNSEITNDIVSHLKSENSSSVASFECDTLMWEVIGQALCVNCSNHNLCAENHAHVLVPGMSCFESIAPVKYGSIIEIESRIILPDTVPELSNISLTPFHTSVEVSYRVSTSGYGGSVFCGAFPSGYVLTSNYAIREKGFGASTPRMETIAKGFEDQVVIITGLIAAQEYGVYCVTEDSSGNELALSSVVEQSETTTTSCCRQVEFSNIPSSVNGDYTKYSGSSESDSYVIKVRVLDTPSQTINVQPVLYHPNGELYVGNNVEFIPVSFTVTPADSDYASKLGSFLVSAVDDAGTYYLKLNISGDGASIFEADAGSFANMNISVDAPIPVPSPPRIKKSIFSDSGSNIIVVFSSPVDLSRFRTQVTSQSWNCAKLLNFAGSDLSTCVWLNSTYLSVQLSSSSYVQPLDVIRLQDPSVAGNYALHAFCLDPNGECSTYEASSSASSTQILFPRNPISPSPSLIIPSVIGMCDDLSIDFSLSTGHGGRDWKSFHWIVTANDGSDVADILSILESIDPSNTDGTINIGVSIIENAHLESVANSPNVTLTSSTTYAISLGLQNYLQNLTASEVSYHSKVVTIDRSSNPPPKVTIVGSASRIVVEGNVIRLNAKGEATSCSNTTQVANVLSYKWQVFSNFVLIPSATNKNTASNPKYFTLPAGSLTGGKTYQVMVTATDIFGARSNDYVTIYIHPKPVTVNVPGGINRLVPAQEQLELSVEGSTSSLVYLWTCYFQTLSSKYGTSCESSVEQCNTNLTSAISTCSISSSFVTENDVMLITIIATNPSSGESGSSQILVSVTQPVKSAKASISSSYDGDKFNTKRKLQLNCTISGEDTSLMANWSLVDDDYITLNDAGVALTRTFRSFEFGDSTPDTVQVTVYFCNNLLV